MTWLSPVRSLMSTWAPILTSQVSWQSGQMCLFSLCLLFEQSWHHCIVTRIHLHLLIFNFHNLWDWLNYWGNVLDWFASALMRHSHSKSGMQITDFGEAKIIILNEFIYLRSGHQCSAPLPQMMCQTGGNYNFQHDWIERAVPHPVEKSPIPAHEVSSWCMCWWLFPLLCGSCVENSSSIATHSPTVCVAILDGQHMMYLPFLSQNFYHTLSTLVNHRCSSSFCGFCKYFFSNI